MEEGRLAVNVEVETRIGECIPIKRKEEGWKTMQMMEVSRMVCACYLLILGAMDWKSYRLPVWMLVMGGGLALGYQLSWKELPVVLVLAGGVVGLFFLVISKMTREAFGYGDSILICILGIYLGLWNILLLLALSFFMTALTAAGVLIKKKFRKKEVLPFVPFLGCGYLLLLLTGGF